LTSDASEFNSDIDQRTGWPDELRILLSEFPRETWRQNASPLAQFWMDKHQHLRNQSSALQSATVDYRERRREPAKLAGWVTPRLQSFLSQLNGHHQIEDFHYFPAFRAADRRLNAGFDVLARDHELLHDGIVNIVEAMNAFMGTLRESGQSEENKQRQAADRFVDAIDPLYRRLDRHLDDEEDLIIPLMLAQK
jgi:hemerythrin-like domain-containing protein